MKPETVIRVRPNAQKLWDDYSFFMRLNVAARRGGAGEEDLERASQMADDAYHSFTEAYR